MILAVFWTVPLIAVVGFQLITAVWCNRSDKTGAEVSNLCSNSQDPLGHHHSNCSNMRQGKWSVGLLGSWFTPFPSGSVSLWCAGLLKYCRAEDAGKRVQTPDGCRGTQRDVLQGSRSHRQEGSLRETVIQWSVACW